ncbi:hypothetical protein QJQ45_000260 [Haematococcus lacustris]|nr:hypothetical protein QJQ45_000260 [Haematococcus lacustris]
MLHRFPGIGSAVYLRLDDSHSRRAMRLVCKQLRAAIDDAVSSLFIGLNDIYDPDEVMALTMPQLRSLDVNCHVDVAVCRAWQRLPHLSSLTLGLTPASGAAVATPHLKGLEHITSLRSLDLTLSNGQVNEGSLAACTQLTELINATWFPALTQLIQLLQLGVVRDLSSDSLPLLATLPQLADLRLNSCPLQPSSQLSRFLFQHLTSLTVTSIHSRDLAALDCPQLQTLSVHQLEVDCAASLRAWASGILQHCSSIHVLITYNHGKEFKAAAAGAGVRQLGPPPSTSVLLEALAPWQPRSGKAIEMLGLGHLSDATREALEWLPVNIKYLTFESCHLLPGALSSVATRLTQLTCLDLTSSPVALAELQLLAARAQQGNGTHRLDEEDEDGEWAEEEGLPPCYSLLPLVEEGQRLDREQQLVWPQQQAQQLKWQQHHHQLYAKLGEAVLQGLQGSHLMPRLQQASRAVPPHPSSSSSSSSVAATHSRSGHGTRSTSPLAGLPLSLPAPPPSPASPLPSNPLARGPPQPSPLPTPLAQLSSTCLVQLLWAFASHEHCQAALLRAAAPVLSARILQGQLSSRRVACVAWAYARLQQLEPRLLSAILRHSMAHAEQYELRYWARLAWAFSTLGWPQRRPTTSGWPA